MASIHLHLTFHDRINIIVYTQSLGDLIPSPRTMYLHLVIVMHIKELINLDFKYLIDQIYNADFLSEPFKHIEINNFLSEQHFNMVVNAEEINLPEFKNDYDLFDGIEKAGYTMVPFPGAITNKKEYIDKRSKGRSVTGTHLACESQGVVLRLNNPKSSQLIQLKKFVESEAFNRSIAEKFNLDFNNLETDGGIQKYLDNYEISPHPDMRKKATAFMVNINPSLDSESANHHTHYLKFKDEKAYVGKYWEGNPLAERCWVPWPWCDTVKQQSKNNSIVIFSPSHDTMHAVRAKYNHLLFQRTQIYGNLWYSKKFTPSTSRLDWQDFQLKRNVSPLRANLKKRFVALRKRLRYGHGDSVDKSRKKNY